MISSPPKWLTVDDAAEYARCGPKTIYAAVRRGQLRAARIGGRRELRFVTEWIDEFLLASATPVLVNNNALGAGRREGV